MGGISLLGWVLQSGPLTPSGNGTGPDISIEKTGVVGRTLREFGIQPAIAKPLGAAITFVIALFVVYTVGRAVVVPLFSRALDRRGLDTHEKRPLRRLLKIILVFAAIGIAFNVAGLSGFFTSLAAIAAAATLAIGFALQDTIANFVAGLFIYIDRPFRIGDWIEWTGSESYQGIVEDITFRVTRVRTFDNELLTVPNSILTGGVIKNPVAKDELRLQFVFGIGYDDDIEQATDIIIEEAEKHPDILDDPAPSVRLSADGALADSYVGLTSRFWIADPNRADFLKIRGEYITAVKNRFDEAGIDIPYPHVDLTGAVGVENSPRNIESTD